MRYSPACCTFLVQSGHFSEDMIPTVGFNMRKVTKGNVTIKVGQQATVSMLDALNVQMKSLPYWIVTGLKASVVNFCFAHECNVLLRHRYGT